MSFQIQNHLPDKWLAYRRPNERANISLFCFPHAGGTAAIFRSWHEQIVPHIEIYPVQLPGRENRLNEPPFTNLESLVEALGHALLPVFKSKPFAFFGHSMGALICFELARYLRKHHGISPLQLFISGACAPQIRCVSQPRLYTLPDADFIEELRRLNGTSESVLNNHELMKLIQPYLRADFAICETYNYQEEAPLNIPFTAFGGKQDFGVSQGELAAWREQTLNAFNLHMFPGDHFFLQYSYMPVLQTLSETLDQLISARNLSQVQ